MAGLQDVEHVVGVVHDRPHVIQRSHFKTPLEFMYCLEWSRRVVDDHRNGQVVMNEDWDEKQKLH